MPEGSWLGPLSFLVLINDLNPDCLVHKYVDDTTLTELLKDCTKPSNMQFFFQQLLSVWHHHITKTQADNIEAIQKRAIRIIFSQTICHILQHYMWQIYPL